MELISPAYDKTRCKSPIYGVPIHEKFAPHLGHCLLLWGYVDRSLNDLLTIMVHKAGAEQPHPSFDKRLTEFLRLSAVSFPDNPEIVAMLTSLGEDARKTAVDRHLLAHGHLTFSMKDGVLKATGRHKGRDHTRSYSLAEIEQLFFDISHIAGRLFMLTSPQMLDPTFAGWPHLSAPAISLLQSFFGKSAPSSPTPP